MLWNTAVSYSIFNTIAVCLGSAVLATVLGLTLAILTIYFKAPGYRLWTVVSLSMVLVPTYVIATAWSAGFGVQGWLRISQVSAALSPSVAIASVVWIHGTAIAPVAFLFCALGIRPALTSQVRQAMLDHPPIVTVFRFLIPNMRPWIAASLLWSMAMTGNDMVVTNLYQVPTLTETVYQQVQFDELRFGSIVVVCSFAVCLALLVFCFVQAFYRQSPSTNNASVELSHSAISLNGTGRWMASLLCLLIVGVLSFVPILNLVVKAGWVATIRDQEIHREWSVGTVVQSIGQTTAFAQEFSWSLQLALCSACLALFLGLVGLWIGFRRGVHAVGLAVMAMGLALPGPIINLGLLKWSTETTLPWIQFLADRTLAWPVLALQFRCLPIAFGLLWIARVRFEERHRAIIELDRALPWRTRCVILGKSLGGPMLAAWIVAFWVAFADLSTYLLVQPPQVTTIAMRMFDLLHYGVKNREAGLALALVTLSASTGAWLTYCFYPRRDRSTI